MTSQPGVQVPPPTPELDPNTPDEAVAVCLDETGTVTLDRVTELLGTDPDSARRYLGDLVYEDPASHGLVPASHYLSGNIRHKLDVARSAAMVWSRWLRAASSRVMASARPVPHSEDSATLLRLPSRSRANSSEVAERSVSGGVVEPADAFTHPDRFEPQGEAFGLEGAHNDGPVVVAGTLVDSPGGIGPVRDRGA